MLIIVQFLRILEMAILIGVLMKWFMPYPRQPALRKFSEFMDRILKPFQVLFPMGGAFLDLGPLLALLLLQMIERVLLHLV
mgnify:CR=1 FL=1